MDYFKRIIIISLFIIGVGHSQWFEFLANKSRGYYTFTVNGLTAIEGEYIRFVVESHKTRVSYTASKRIVNNYVWLNRYETNFSNMDTTSTQDSLAISARLLFLGGYKYGSALSYRCYIKTDKDSLYSSNLQQIIIPDIGCLYDLNKYPLVDAEGKILYSNN